MSRRRQCGWVVRQALFTRHGRTLTSFWHGPETPWGQHFGPLLDDRTNTLSLGVGVFATRADAREAMAVVGLRGCVPVPLEVALDQLDLWAVAS